MNINRPGSTLLLLFLGRVQAACFTHERTGDAPPTEPTAVDKLPKGKLASKFADFSLLKIGDPSW